MGNKAFDEILTFIHFQSESFYMRYNTRLMFIYAGYNEIQEIKNQKLNSVQFRVSPGKASIMLMGIPVIEVARETWLTVGV